MFCKIGYIEKFWKNDEIYKKILWDVWKNYMEVQTFEKFEENFVCLDIKDESL